MEELSFVRPIAIGSVMLENRIALAPMAGTTDCVYRQICRDLGAGLTVTELVSARGMIYDPTLKRNFRYLEITPEEQPVAIQLFGSDPADFSRAINMILAHPVLASCAMIDINMGCPVTKVVRQGAGSALMKDPMRAGAIVAASVNAAAAANKPVTVKIRSGWDREHLNAVEIARICQESGAAAVTIHARTRHQMYSGRADWQQIARVREVLHIPLFGNGDVTSVKSATEMLRQTGADGVMIGRAAQGNPWLFAQFEPIRAEKFHISFGLDGLPSKDIRFAWIVRHVDGMINRLGESAALREMRPQLACYLKQSHRAAFYRKSVMTADTRCELLAILEEWRID